MFVIIEAIHLLDDGSRAADTKYTRLLSSRPAAPFPSILRLSNGRRLYLNEAVMMRITSTISIPDRELEFEFFRASGPGGQNVNKVATAVQLRFDVRRSPSLPEDVRRRLIHLAGRRLTEDGILILLGRRFRTQDQNRADALARLKELIARAAVTPKRRKPTRPTGSSRERRLQTKRRIAQRKSSRLRRHIGDE